MHFAKISIYFIRHQKSLKVKKAKQIKNLKWGQRIRVGGMVVEGTVKRDPKSLKVRFDLNDIGPSITVEYEGILPDLFRRRARYRRARRIKRAYFIRGDRSTC